MYTEIMMDFCLKALASVYRLFPVRTRGFWEKQRNQKKRSMIKWVFCAVRQGSFTTTLPSLPVLSVPRLGTMLGTEREMGVAEPRVFVMWYSVFCTRMTKKVHA